MENVAQEPITAFSVSGTTLTFTGAPPSGTNNIYVVYRNFDSGAQVYVADGSITYAKLANNIRIFTTDNLTPNGNNTVFTLTEPPADANTVMVTVDGVVQRAPVHYTTTGNTITFTSSPPAGANVHVRHLGFRTTSTITTLPANTTITQPVLLSPTITTPTITTPTITGNTTAAGFILPSANTTYDLGSPSLRWSNIYSSTLNLSGGQIAFPATQNSSADANTLDDYEEGTWTPTLTFSGGTTGITYDGTYRNGTYVKVGKLVWLNCRLGLTNKGSSTGTARVTGLPFTPSGGASGNEIIVGNVWWVNFSNPSNYMVNIRMDATNTGYMELMSYSTSSENPVSNGFFTNTTQIAFTIVYYAQN